MSQNQSSTGPDHAGLRRRGAAVLQSDTQNRR